ncbi:MAG: rhomboid family intramembrane serine protease [Candidatus Eisenbacteria bacterium]
MRRTTGAIVCPKCERLIGAGEQKCPFCGAWQPGMFGYGPMLQRWLGGKLDLTRVVIVTCVILFVASLLLDPGAIFHMRGLFDILSPSSTALLRLGATSDRLQQAGFWWTLFTAVFLHGSALHILFNMLFTSRYLPIVVDLFGSVRAFVIFMVAGVGGFLVSNLAGVHLTIGASGAIYGLFAALIVYGRRTGQSQLTGQLWGTVVIMFLFGFMMPGTNNWAHGGGFAAGFIAAEAMRFSHERESRWELALAGALALVTVVGVVLSFVFISGMMR